MFVRMVGIKNDLVTYSVTDKRDDLSYSDAKFELKYDRIRVPFIDGYLNEVKIVYGRNDELNIIYNEEFLKEISILRVDTNNFNSVLYGSDINYRIQEIVKDYENVDIYLDNSFLYVTDTIDIEQIIVKKEVITNEDFTSKNVSDILIGYKRHRIKDEDKKEIIENVLSELVYNREQDILDYELESYIDDCTGWFGKEIDEPFDFYNDFKEFISSNLDRELERIPTETEIRNAKENMFLDVNTDYGIPEYLYPYCYDISIYHMNVLFDVVTTSDFEKYNLVYNSENKLKEKIKEYNRSSDDKLELYKKKENGKDSLFLKYKGNYYFLNDDDIAIVSNTGETLDSYVSLIDEAIEMSKENKQSGQNIVNYIWMSYSIVMIFPENIGNVEIVEI